MRRVVVLAVLALMVVPLAARADTIDIQNKGGTIQISQSGIASHGSHLTQWGTVQGSGLGFVSFTTGALVSGSIQSGGVFSSTGSTFLIVGHNKALPHQGTLFSGSFTGNINWTLISQKGQEFTYQLTGNLVGQLWNGRTVTGSTTQTIITYKGQLAKGIGHIQLGTGQLNGVPEPGTLGLLGTGLLGIAGLVRRKVAV